MVYEDNRPWSDNFILAMKDIIGPRLLEVAPLELDQQQATDLVVFSAKDVRISCRVRRPKYWIEQPHDNFTMRSKGKGNGRVELTKVVDGWGDWFLYGHAKTEGEPYVLWKWMIINLHALRAHWIRHPATRHAPEYPNGDGTWLRAYAVTSFATQGPHDGPILVDTNIPELAAYSLAVTNAGEL